eukprot:NODE_4_length_4662_cov_63.651378_g3_i0.p1 GENE.NODE_4_length_4662_cov_63.651378_g3_i0~~NODE_4_length_4662_cov_63.651378_g3_i0.p1  ORF type:complete len:1226 (+),score=432.43 NODE_4_length_4662_cov_63.651378_g3_i0:260-3679(+)
MDGVTLFLTGKKMDYYGAECAAHSMGGSLVSVLTSEVLQFVKYMGEDWRAASDFNQFWLGGKKDSGDWVWADGSDVPLRGEAGVENWHKKQPKGTGTRMAMKYNDGQNDFLWYARSESSKYCGVVEVDMDCEDDCSSFVPARTCHLPSLTCVASCPAGYVHFADGSCGQLEKMCWAMQCTGAFDEPTFMQDLAGVVNNGETFPGDVLATVPDPLATPYTVQVTIAPKAASQYVNMEQRVRDAANANNVLTLGSVTCDLDAFDPSGACPVCNVPVVTDGYDASNCADGSTEADCVLACATGYAGTPTATCAIGGTGTFVFDGCVEEDPCGDGTLDQGEECDDGNTADGDCCSSTCTLEDGYGWMAGCYDINECNGEHECDSFSDCTQMAIDASWTAPGYTCECRNGYTGAANAGFGNTGGCTNINECEGEHECDSLSTCTEIDYSNAFKPEGADGYTCECRNGYTGAPNAGYGSTNGCSNINECEGEHECDSLSTCTEIDYSNAFKPEGADGYTCECRNGYTGAPNAGYGSTNGCSNINECEGEHECDSLSTCTEIDYSNAFKPEGADGYTCECRNGYTGAPNAGYGSTNGCSNINECEGEHECDSLSTCTEIDYSNAFKPEGADGYTCECRNGYTGAPNAGYGATNGCSNINECEGEHECDSLSTCTEIDYSNAFKPEGADGYTCECRNGYTGAPNAGYGSTNGCSNINECEGEHECDSLSTCTEIDYSNAFKPEGADGYTCECRNGYTGGPNAGYGSTNGCSNINECEGEHECDSLSTCTEIDYSNAFKPEGADGYTCECRNGYTGAPNAGYGATNGCSNINECEGEHECDSLSTCTEIDYSNAFKPEGADGYTCECRNGYTGAPNAGYGATNGCSNINECEGEHECDSLSTCTEIDYSNAFKPEGADGYTCECRNGYTGAPNAGYGATNGCSNINECEGEHECDSLSTCTEIDYSNAFKPEGADGYTCECRNGYTGAPNAGYGATNGCSNINECEGEHECDSLSTCTEIDYSNAFKPEGADGYTCECRNGYTGGPNAGYGATNGCSNINECEGEHECDALSTCTEIDYSNAFKPEGADGYTCECREGYTGAPNAGYGGTGGCSNINECDPNPCTGGQTCTEVDFSNQLWYAPGYTCA